MDTRLLYLDASDDLASEAVVIWCRPTHAAEHSLALNQTPFYPEGGGQAGDVGTIHANSGVMHVTSTVRRDGVVEHRGTIAGTIQEGQLVRAVVTAAPRALNCRLHSAGELLCAAITLSAPEAGVISANHRSGQSSVTIDIAVEPSARASMIRQLHAHCKTMIEAALPITITNVHDRAEVLSRCGFLPGGLDETAAVRIVAIGQLLRRPCGGTHVKSTADIGGLRIRSLTSRAGNTRIGYDLEAPRPFD